MDIKADLEIVDMFVKSEPKHEEEVQEEVIQPQVFETRSRKKPLSEKQKAHLAKVKEMNRSRSKKIKELEKQEQEEQNPTSSFDYDHFEKHMSLYEQRKREKLEREKQQEEELEQKYFEKFKRLERLKKEAKIVSPVVVKNVVPKQTVQQVKEVIKPQIEVNTEIDYSSYFQA